MHNHQGEYKNIESKAGSCRDHSYKLQILFFFFDKDKRVDSWIRRKNTAQPHQDSYMALVNASHTL